MSNAPRTLADLYATDPEGCRALCEAAGLYYCTTACEQGRGDSPFLRAVSVADARRDAKRNGRRPA